MTITIRADGRPQCDRCGYVWSAAIGDDEIPAHCDCEDKTEETHPVYDVVVSVEVFDRGALLNAAADWLVKHAGRDPLQAAAYMAENGVGTALRLLVDPGDLIPGIEVIDTDIR